ncbi:hypothetical protein DVH05_023758 [Phytophthora capsici]|nr:hypothetical protein DVH05_023758 [Phytophthora capsici]
MQAPEVNKVGDTYYLYYSVSSFGTQNSAIGLTRSKTMEAGSWVDEGSVGVTSDASKQYNAIDPNLIQVGSQYYLNFGSYWQGLHQTKMTSLPAKSTGGSAYQVAFTSNFEVLEAAFEFAYNGYYYLFFSKGSCCGYDKTRPAKGKEYRILACRSKSPTGDFVDKNGADCRNNGGTIVLESHDWVYGPGGQGVYNDPKYGPVLYYHYGKCRWLVFTLSLFFTNTFCLFQKWTLASGMRMETSASVGTSLTSRVVGLLCRCSAYLSSSV